MLSRPLSFCRKVTMNGRCETDPLDRAIDVCDRCFGEFCETHLVRPKGRKHPFCNDCALSASGVRGSAKVELRGDRRTAKQRRKELREAEAALDDEHVFEFFEYEPDDECIPDDDERTPIPDLEPAARGDRSSPTTAGTPTSRAAVADEPAADQHDDHSDDRDEPADGASGDPIPLEDTPATPAVAQLERLRREAEARANEVDTEPPEQTETAEPATTSLVERFAEPLPPPPNRPLPNRQSTRPQVPSSDRGTRPGRRRRRHRRHDSRRHDSRRHVVRRARGGSAAADADSRPRRPTAPMIGEVRHITGRRATDQSRPTDPSGGGGPVGDHGGNATGANSVGASLPGTGGTLNAVDGFDADRQHESPHSASTSPAPHGPPRAVGGDDRIDAGSNDEARPDTVDDGPHERESTSSGTTSGDDEVKRADVDDRGNWIPPILRGMAPNAATAKDDLPQRSRR